MRTALTTKGNIYLLKLIPLLKTAMVSLREASLEHINTTEIKKKRYPYMFTKCGTRLR